MVRVRNGDALAFAIMYDALAPRLFGTVKRVLRDPAMSEEVTQDVFLEIWRNAERFDSTKSSVSAWAITIARRRAIDRVRSEQCHRDQIERLAARCERNTEPSLDDALTTGAEANRVRSTIARLPDHQRDVIRLAFLEGHTHGEIADRLDLPLGTVKGRVRGGLRRLRRELERPASPSPTPTTFRPATRSRSNVVPVR